MKKLYLIISVIIISSVSYSQWIKTNLPNDYSLLSLLVDGNKLFVGTINNGVFVSTDSGQNWEAINSGLTDSTIYSIVVNGANIFVGTANEGVFLSTNSGQSWTEKNNGLFSHKIRSLFITDGTLFAGTYDGSVFRSTDNGNNWETGFNGFTEMGVFSFAKYGNHLFAGTDNGGVFYTSDNGNNWEARSLNFTAGWVTSMCFIDSTLLVSTDGAINGVYRTTNYGYNWQSSDSNLTSRVVKSFVVKSNIIFAGTYWGIFMSSDNGISWNNISDGYSPMTTYALASNEIYLFAGGFLSNVWRRPLSELITEVNSFSLPNEFKLEQNYPNPFNPETTIKYSIPKTSKISLVVYDVLGREIATLVNDEKLSGNYSVQFNASNFSSGVYFYVLRAYNFIDTKKFILLK